MHHFKIKSSKNLLINRLLKKITSNQQPDNNNRDNDSTNILDMFSELFGHLCCRGDISDHHDQTSHSSRSYLRIRKYLENLPRKDLEQLSRVIDNQGCDLECCILSQPHHPHNVPCNLFSRNDSKWKTKHDLQSLIQNDQTFDQQVLLWIINNIRNLDHSVNIVLRPLPWCSLYKTLNSHLSLFPISHHQSLCLNPYHWAVLMPQQELDQQYYDYEDGDDLNPPVYPMDTSQTKPNLIVGFSESCSIKSTDSNDDNFNKANHSGDQVLEATQKASKWCKLNYWEFRERILSNLKVKNDFIHIQECHNITEGTLSSDSRQQFLSLSRELSRHRECRKEVLKTRDRIGLGVTLFRDSEHNVWLYNRSTTCSVFVESPTFNNNNHQSQYSSNVVKVLPGHLIKAYDCKLINLKKSKSKSNNTNGPSSKIDFDQFRFSFVKGFGDNYRKSDIIFCPCWMEVMLY